MLATSLLPSWLHLFPKNKHKMSTSRNLKPLKSLFAKAVSNIIAARTKISVALGAAFLLFTFSCSSPQEPVFKTLDNVKTTKANAQEITVTAEAVYFNPNGISLTLSATDIDVFANDVEVAKIAQDLAAEIPAKSEFRIPLTFSAKPRDIYQKDKGGLIGGALNALLNKKVDVRYSGTVTVKMLGIPYTSEIDYEEVVSLKR